MSDPKPVSRNCAEGRHKRCLGSVYIYPPEGGSNLVPCVCPVANCGHGPEKRPPRKRS